MSAASLRGSYLVGALVAGAALVVGVLAVAEWRFPSNDDVLVRNATSNDILDVVVLRGEGADAAEVARFARIAPGEQSLARAGLGQISVEFTDARGRWIALRVMWRDEDDVRSRSTPEVLDVTADAVGGTPVRRTP